MKNINQFYRLSFFILLFFLSTPQHNANVQFNVGVILDLDQLVGKVRLRCMSMAISYFYDSHSSYKTRVVLHIRNSTKDNLAIASAALDLLENVEVEAIIVPETLAPVNLVVDLGHRYHVPILSFTTSSTIIPSSHNPYHFRTALNDSCQVQSISAIFQHFGWKEAILIYDESDYGNHFISHFINTFQQNDIRVSYVSAITSLATEEQIGEELYKLMSMQSKIFVIHVTPSFGSRLFLKAKDLGMISEGYAFIITNGLSNALDSVDPSFMKSMQGVLGVRPYVWKSKNLENFTARWTRENFKMPKLNVFDLWAYDTVWALAMAVEEVGGSHGFLMPKVMDKSNFLSRLRVSKVGPELVQAISKTRFTGLSGDIYFIDRQLQSSLFQIINVIGNQGREVGIWSPENGMTRELNMTNYKNIGAIIWPGDSIIIPKGWSLSPNRERLKIAVPVNSFEEFVKVTWNPNTKAWIFTGYCVELFNAVMEELPYVYEFVPFNTASYNDMIYQVYLKKFDAVVGDLTITTNRSLYVDFTIPYSETGVSMVMRIKDNEKKDGWVFLKPLSIGMWLATIAAFVFTGCVIWILEHRVNTHFRGSPSQQLGMIFWFSFSTIVFAHRERLVNNLSRFVLIVWVFVVLILTSSYTANLTSMLTVQQIEVHNIYQLVKRGNYIGYQCKIVKELLVKRLGIDANMLKKLNSLDAFDDALSRGSKRGGVSAIVDELPYLEVFIRKHCDKYIMVGSIYDSNGFGYAFHKGSPIVNEVSKSILKVKETQKMRTIESNLYKNVADCINLESFDSLVSLTVDRFEGLFLIVGISSTFAMLIFFGFFFREHLYILTNSSSESSFAKRLVNFVNTFFKEEASQSLGANEMKKVIVNEPEESILPSSSAEASQVNIVERQTTCISPPSSAANSSTSLLTTYEEIIISNQGEEI